MTRVAVLGALGRMGTEVLKAVLEDADLEAAGLVDAASSGRDVVVTHPLNGQEVLPAVAELDPDSTDVAVDFTHAEAAVQNIEWALDNGVHCVVGTTGIAPGGLERIRKRSLESGANVLIAPNFALGAVLMMRFAREAAAVFDQCEIIELHHRGKKDAPSGTALATARIVEEAMSAADVPGSVEKDIPGTRGGSLGAVRIHSVRLDGYVAHQEVIFGGKGQTLSVRHDTTDRSCFMPGVLLAVKRIAELPGLTVGIDSLL
jgi:4-hydroxy-tetrahydrodipicolinate reductase